MSHRKDIPPDTCRVAFGLDNMLHRIESSPEHLFIEELNRNGHDYLARFLNHSNHRRNRPFLVLLPNKKVSDDTYNFLDARRLQSWKKDYLPALAQEAKGGMIFLSELTHFAPAAQEEICHFIRGHAKTYSAHPEKGVRMIAASSLNADASINREELIPDLLHCFKLFSLDKCQKEENGDASFYSLLIRHLRDTASAHDDLSLDEILNYRLRRFIDPLQGYQISNLHEMVIESVEKSLLKIVLEHTRGNQSRAAQILGINRNTLRAKIEKYRLDQ